MPKERFLPVVIHRETCRGCGRCQEACRNDAIVFKGAERYVDYSKCKACSSCIYVCPVNAITVIGVYEGEAIDILIDEEKCAVSDGCTECITTCPTSIYSKDGGHIAIQRDKISECRGCKACEAACPEHAIKVFQA
ncbi:MAG: 4Fe-4S binding protein [Promethearchaeota archaeon]